MRFAKIIEPTSAANEVARQREGALFADRTLGVTIIPSRVSVDLKRLMRLEMVETEDYREDILRIAEASFVYDRRFNLTPDCDVSVRHEELKRWVDELGPTWVALMKGVPVGFMNLKEVSSAECGVQSADALSAKHQALSTKQSTTLSYHLVAVEEKYRLSGAALGLYAKGIEVARERGYKKLVGRISSQNVAVLNIYAMFGAQFSAPEDIFLKELS